MSNNGYSEIENWASELGRLSGDISENWRDDIGNSFAEFVMHYAQEAEKLSSDYAQSRKDMFDCICLCEEILNGPSGGGDDPEKVLVKRR